MLVISAKLLVDSGLSLINGQQLTFSVYLVVVCVMTILTKFTLYIYTNYLYKKNNNILLKANARDHFNDCIVTFFTLISVLLSLRGIYWFDGVVGIRHFHMDLHIWKQDIY